MAVMSNLDIGSDSLEFFNPELHDEISHIANSGYFIMLGFGRKGSDFMRTTYPTAWVTEYDKRSYHFRDPVFIWSVANNGQKRWSEVKMPDPFNIMTKARKFGLNYGATFTQSSGFTKKSNLCVARHDRELTNSEMRSLARIFQTLCNSTSTKAALSNKQLDVVQCLANGMNLLEAAAHLKISESAVKSRLHTSRDALSCKTNGQLIAQAIRHELIH